MIFTDCGKVPVLILLEIGNTIFSWAKKLIERWYLLISEKVLFWTFRWWEIRSFLSQEVDGKMIFTGYWEVLVLNFSVMGNTVFFSAKKLMERWYLLGLFELSMIFQDLGNMVFRAVILAVGTITRFSWNTKFFLKVLLVNSIKYHCGRKESIINQSVLHSNLKEKDPWSKSKLKNWVTRKNQQGTKTLLRQGETFEIKRFHVARRF